MLVAFQLPSICLYDSAVCDLDHMKIFAVYSVELPFLPDLGGLRRRIRGALARVGVVSGRPTSPDWAGTR
jgi:hypothetical protein